MDQLTSPDPEAVKKGLPNLEKHLSNIRKFDLNGVVAINRFPSDEAAEIQVVKEYCESLGFKAVVADIWAKGGAGGTDLAQAVVEAIAQQNTDYKPLYDWAWPVEQKVETIAKEIYGARAVEYGPQAKKDLKRIKNPGLTKLTRLYSQNSKVFI